MPISNDVDLAPLPPAANTRQDKQKEPCVFCNPPAANAGEICKACWWPRVLRPSALEWFKEELFFEVGKWIGTSHVVELPEGFKAVWPP